LTKSRIAAAHGQLSGIGQVASLCTSLNTCFLGPSWSHNPNSISIGSAVFAQLTAECPHSLQWAALSPIKIAPSHGDLDPINYMIPLAWAHPSP